jgi:hypothetical protein
MLGHVLRGGGGNRDKKMTPKLLNIGTADLETDPFLYGRVPKAFSADLFYDNDHHTTYWSSHAAKDCWQKIRSLPPRIWYFHNGGKFDFFFFFEFIPRKLIKKVLCIGGRVVQIVFENGLEIRDSYALIPRALREWAKDDIDYKKLESNVRESHKDEIIKYERKDTEYLSEMLTAFIDTYGMHLTLASAAFKILHKQFNVPRKRISESLDARMRPYYFSGRVEFNKLGHLGKGYKCVDVNSSFPWSMTQEHPEGGECATSSTLPTKHVVQSFMRCKCESHGAFPFREEDGSVSFPSDGRVREFYVTGWEWIAALDLGMLVNARLISVTTPTTTRNYKEYVDYFYKIKSEAETANNKGERLFAKLLMNSGYGKFGQDPREHEEIRICDYRTPPDDSATWSVLKDDDTAGITIYTRPAKLRESSFNNVLVAASITGCSRALLLRAKAVCKGVAYLDTDSIIAKDISRLKLGRGLGEWKLEAEFSEFHIGGKKLYAGKIKGSDKWKTASKGARLTPEQIVQVAGGAEVEYFFDAPSYSIRGIKPNNETGATKWLRFTKRRIRRADKLKSFVNRNTPLSYGKDRPTFHGGFRNRAR